MEYKNLTDCHSHSSFSLDSNEKLEDMCKQAYESNLKVYAITDHCECEFFVADNYEKSTLNSFNLLCEMKEKYKDKIKILKGIEIGQPLDNVNYTNKILSRNYDFVIASIHRIKNVIDYYYINYKSYTKSEIEKMLYNYYLENLEVAKWNKFDSLAHLTYPLRYITGEHNISVSMEQYDDIFEKIFKEIIKNKKAIEINTSGLRQKINDFLPCEKYIKMYKDLGGEYITVGSDAHKCEDVAKGIDDAYDLLKKIGFENITYFENRQAKFLKIE